MFTMRTTLTGIFLSTMLLVPTGLAAQDDDPGDGPDTTTLLPYAAVSGSARGVASGGGESESSETLPEVRVTGYNGVVTMTADDPRLSGRWTGTQNYHQFVQGDPGAVRAGTAWLVNDGGSWSITFTGFTPPGAPSSLSARHDQMLFSGEGGYEGLSAIIVVSPDGTPAEWTFEGVIFPGPMPEFPPPMAPAE